MSSLYLISDKIERRQEITLELTPAQKVDVDGSREIPTILISENGYQLGPQGCAGGSCGSYAIDMPPIGQLEKLMAPQNSYDPYAENYSPYPLPSYPYVPPPPVQSQVISATAPPPRWANAGWNAPLIPSGTFAQALQGTPTVSASTIPTSTTSAPPPVPGALPVDPNFAGAAPPTGLPAAPLPLAAPINLAAGFNGAVPGAPVPTPAGDVPPPTAEVTTPPAPEIKDDMKIEDKPEEKKDVPPPPPPPQRRGLRAAAIKKDSPSNVQKRNTASQRLRKRQLEQEPSTKDSSLGACDPSQVKKVEVLVPVTESELQALQEGTVELISYPSVGPDGSEETLYDVLPVSQPPAKIDPSLKEIFEKNAFKRSESTFSQEPKSKQDKADEEVTLKPRSLNVGSPGAPTFKTLDKRLKHGEK